MDFEDILLEIINDVGDGRKIDIEKYCKKYPQYKKELLVKLRVAEFIKRNLQEDDFGGRKFGEYIILQELSRGGMGIVFLAIQPSLSRLVTIKILPPHFAYDKDALKNFHEEAKTVAKFNHPNIVPIYSFGEEGGINYIAMNYIAGSSLKDMVEHIKTMRKIHSLKADDIRNIISTPPLEKQDITQQSITLKRDFNFWNKPYFQFIALVGNEISEAINYAHQSGICHGDIKLSNILLTKELIPMIVDFGLSKDLRKSSSKSKEFAGTFVYAAPEQIRENIINEKTDIWSLGVTLYELLTLKNPFIDKNVEKMMAKILKSEVTPLRVLNKKIPVELEAIVLKCLEKKPENRYSSALELSQDLNNYLESKPIKAKPIGITGRLCKWIKRRPILAGFICIFLCTVLSFSFLAYKVKIDRLMDEGLKLQDSQEFERSEKIFSKILKLTNGTPFMAASREKALLGLAQVKSINQPDSSIEYYKQCLTINPKNIYALWGIALIYEDQGNSEEAIKCYKSIIKFCPNHFPAGLHLAQLSYKLGRIDEANECYLNILKISPNYSMAVSDYSRFLREIGKTEEMLSFWAKRCTPDIFEKDSIMRWEIISAMHNLINKSQNTSDPIDNYEKIKILLISKGFDENNLNVIIDAYIQTYPTSWFLLNYTKKNQPGITPSKMKAAFEDAVRQHKEKQRAE